MRGREREQGMRGIERNREEDEIEGVGKIKIVGKKRERKRERESLEGVR